MTPSSGIFTRYEANYSRLQSNITRYEANYSWLQSNITRYEAVVTKYEALMTSQVAVVTRYEALITSQVTVVTRYEAVVTSQVAVVTRYEAVVTRYESYLTLNQRYSSSSPLACSSPFLSGRMCGKRMTSRMECLLVMSIVRRSTPMPMPAAGGMPYERARM